FDSSLLTQLRPPSSTYLILFAVLTVICTLFYTASVLDPEESAERLKTLGGKLAGGEPGEPTAACLDRPVSRTTLGGGAYLALAVMLPEILVHYAHVQLYFSGVGLLITICTILDLDAQFRAARKLT